MRTLSLIVIFFLFLLLIGCTVGKKEPSGVQEKEAVVSMDQAITEYLENNLFIPPPTGVKTFAAYDLLGVSENGTEKIAYLWALIRTYGVDPSVGIGPRSASSLPLALFLKEENGSFTVVNHRQPGDGSNYWPDIKKIFPEEFHERILNYGRDGKDLEQPIKAKVNNYLRTVGVENTV